MDKIYKFRVAGLNRPIALASNLRAIELLFGDVEIVDVRQSLFGDKQIISVKKKKAKGEANEKNITKLKISLKGKNLPACYYFY